MCVLFMCITYTRVVSMHIFWARCVYIYITIYWFIYLFMYLFIYSFIYLSIYVYFLFCSYLFIHLCTAWVLYKNSLYKNLRGSIPRRATYFQLYQTHSTLRIWGTLDLKLSDSSPALGLYLPIYLFIHWFDLFIYFYTCIFYTYDYMCIYLYLNI
jgi:hypothetical protein